MIFQLISVLRKPNADILKEYPRFILGLFLFLLGICSAYILEILGLVIGSVGFLLMVFDLYKPEKSKKLKGK